MLLKIDGFIESALSEDEFTNKFLEFIESIDMEFAGIITEVNDSEDDKPNGD